MRRKMFGSGFPAVVESLNALALALCEQGKFAEAERLTRERLGAENLDPDDWRTFNTRSLLGASLLGQKKYIEAEPPLVSGCEGLKQRQEQIPAPSVSCLKRGVERLIQLYEVTDRADWAAECHKGLKNLERAQADNQPLAQTPAKHAL